MPLWLQVLLALAWITLALLSAGHALLNKREPRSAWLWVVTCFWVPWLGALIYWALGNNRIQTRGQKLRGGWPADEERPQPSHSAPVVPSAFSELARIADAVTRLPLLGGNRVQALHNGEAAYPAMLEAIREATESVHLASYIFNDDENGQRFADALVDAHERGLDVKVLLDGIGALYPPRGIRRRLARRGIEVARFLPPTFPRPNLHFNLRNHRKLLVLDGRVAFTGGMNLSERHLAEKPQGGRVIDVHFRLEGPVVAQLQDVFGADWSFATDAPFEAADPSAIPPAGEAYCRGIADGPNEDLDKLKWILLGAISSAKKRVRIMTPYFIPEREFDALFSAAALRGVEVEIMLPGKNNLPLVAWATDGLLEEMLERGVRVYYQPPPFVHSKLLIVDDHYVQVGSANLDPRSLRLNFEFNVEIYGKPLAEALNEHFDRAREASRELTAAQLRSRPLWKRLRDSAAALMSPYL